MRRTVAAVGLVALVAAAGCTGEEGGGTPPPTTSARRAAGGTIPTEDAVRAATLGPLVDALAPSRLPVQAGPELRGRPLPTNQWWTSALTGPSTSNLWARPLVARATPDGLLLAATTTVVTSADAIVTPFAPALSIGGPLEGVEVTAFGDFSVRLALRRSGADPLAVDLAQGNPVMTIDVPPGPLSVAAGVDGDDPVTIEAVGPAHARVSVGAETWDLLADLGSWEVDGRALRLEAPGPTVVAVAPRPAAAGPAWDEVVAGAAGRPVRTTTAALAVDWAAGVVRQVLRWDRPGAGPSPVALLPHHVAALAGGPEALGPPLGRYASALGPLTVVDADQVVVEHRLPGLLAALPALRTLDVTAAERSAILTDLRRDLADGLSDGNDGHGGLDPGGGSYRGPKALGRLAVLAELAAGLDADAELTVLLPALRAGLRDWATYDGPGDERWLAREPAWGGIVAHPPEFGNQDYNDHHFQFGYLIRAAATLVELSPDDLPALRPAIDLLVADVLGAAAPGVGEGVPPFRVFNAYEGRSAASGFAPLDDGADQESSSEAVHAWEAIVRWGLATRRDHVATAGVARYVAEAAAARAYWLGELPGVRAPGYAHDVAGIVWGGKVDFATWFDPRASAAIGIQLLPFTAGSLYRDDPTAARARVAAARAADGDALLWPDLFVMEEALADPGAAAAAVGRVATVEAGSSRALLRAWVLLRDRLGAPDGRLDHDRVRATGPHGLAFPGWLVARNPGPDPVDVTFVDGAGAPVATVAVAAGATEVRRR